MTRRVVAAFIVLYAGIGALSPYLPVYYESLGLGLDTIGLLTAGYATAAMLGAPLWGATSDRFGAARPILAASAACAAIAATVLALVSGTLLVALAAVGLALGMSGIMPILDARALEVSRGGSDYASFRVWGSGAFIVGVVLTGWVTERAGIGAMFAVLVPTLAATALVGLGIRSRPMTAPLARLTAVGSVLRHRTLVGFLLVVLVTWTSSTTINAFFSIHLVEIGAPQWLLGLSWAIGAAVEVPVMLTFVRLERRIGLERILLLGAVCFALRAAAIVSTSDPLVVTLTMILHGIGFALFLVGGVTYVSRHAPAGAAATAQGMLVAIVFGLAQVIGPGVGGALAEGIGLRGTFAIAGVGSLIAVGAMAWVAWRLPSSDVGSGLPTVR